MISLSAAQPHLSHVRRKRHQVRRLYLFMITRLRSRFRLCAISPNSLEVSSGARPLPCRSLFQYRG
jgi:hypothetical protein